MTALSIEFLFTAEAALGRTWKAGHEGLSPALAFLLFLALAGLTLAAYLRCAPGVAAPRKWTLAALRVAAAAILCALFAKPVLHLTESTSVRQPLAVLIDASRSMDLPDRRDAAIDINRAAIAAGLLDPAADVTRPPAPGIPDQVANLTRSDLVGHLGSNPKLNLWPRLAAASDLRFYQFGATARALEVPSGAAAPAFSAEEPVTALGEAVRQVVQEPRPQPLAGVVLVTDGGNNHGLPPAEAAQIAAEAQVPLFIYGTGVTSPPDVRVSDVTSPVLAFAGERLEVRATVTSHSLDEQPATAVLTADGVEVATAEITTGGDTARPLAFQFVPEKTGPVKLEVTVPPRPGEISADNNTASTVSRITDSKFRVLLIEQEPRWDFRFLLDYLQRDPRLVVKSVMIDGEPGLATKPGSPFLPALPDSREEFFESQVLILGDVSPKDLGEERMQHIAEWVEAGGGIIFLAGPNHNPASYLGTPLELLLPVVPEPAAETAREPEPFPLELSPAGRQSPYLRMDEDPALNQAVWSRFPGVRWAAPVVRAKPGAEVLLEDGRASSAGREGRMPVFAMQGYGSGKCVYFGTDETYRWRSRTGEKYYSILWGQIMQTLALQLLDGASPLTQLRTDRKQYDAGDRVSISGNVYTGNYEPLVVPSLEGVLTRLPDGPPRAIHLTATGRNFFRAEFEAAEPGSYTFHTTRDPSGVLRFEVVDPDRERTQTALDERTLKSMAAATGGKFLREEVLHTLPDLVAAAGIRVASHRKLELWNSPWLLAVLLALLASEWLLRRLSRLK